MKNNKYNGIHLRWYGLSNDSILALYILGLLGFYLIFIINACCRTDRILPAGIVALIFAFLFYNILLYCYYQDILITKETLTFKRFSAKPIIIPVSEIKAIFAVGNEQDNVLCLSCYTVEELAAIQEKRLTRNLFTRQDIPFRKRISNWQDDFAAEYLRHIRYGIFTPFKENRIIMLEMQTPLQQAMKEMFPHLPYYNFSQGKDIFVSPYSSFANTGSICLQFTIFDPKVYMETDGIHVKANKKEIVFIPAEEIKTAVRIDLFTSYHKYFPHHLPVLFITSLSCDELASKEESNGYKNLSLPKNKSKSLSALTAATALAYRWNGKAADHCVIPYTKKNIQKLQDLYPQVVLDDSSSKWIINDPQ